MKVRAALAALAILAGVGLGGGGPASADPASEALLRGFVAWVDASPDWSASVGDVRSDGRDTVAENLVFTRDDPHVAIRVETLGLKDLRARAGGGFETAAVTLGATEIVADNADVTIPSGTASELSMPSFDGAGFDPRHMMQSWARLYGLMAEGGLGGLRVPLVSFDLKVPAADADAADPDADDTGADKQAGADKGAGPGTGAAAGAALVHVTYRDLTIGRIARGVIERETLGPVTVASDAPGSTMKFSLDKIEAEKIDLAAFAHVLDETQYRDGQGDGVWRPLMARASYKGLSASGDHGGAFRADEITVENLDGRQTEKPFTRDWDQVLDPEVPEDAKSDMALDAVTHMVSAFRIGTVRVGPIAMTAPRGDGSARMDGLTLTGWSSDGLDSAILKGFAAKWPQGEASIGGIEAAGFVAPDIHALLGFAALEKDADPAEHAEVMKAAFAALPRLKHFAIENVSGGEGDETFSYDRLSLDLDDWNAIFAQSTDFAIEGLTIPRTLLDKDPQAAEIIDGLGYDSVKLGFSLKDRWDADAGTDKASWSLTLADGGEVNLSYTLNGLTTDWLMNATAAAAKSEDSMDAVTTMLSDLTLSDAKLSVTDRSILDRAFGVAAKRQGLTIDGAAYRQQMRSALPFLLSAVLPADLAKRFAPPIQDFMAGSQTLSAIIAPPAPIAVLQLAAMADDPLSLPDKLNLKLTSAPAKK